MHEPVLRPAPESSWDDQAIWTGCVIAAPDGGWLMFYTGVSRGDDASVQRIGAARSPDLHTWTRLGDIPLVSADPRWYETAPERTFDGVAWRDPWVFAGPDGRWHMVVTASAAGWPADTGGVIGHAVSDDLLHWEVQPPLTRPGQHRCLEVPQVVEVAGQYLLVHSIPRAEPAGRVEEEALPLGDTWCARAEGPLGPYHLDDAWRLEDSGLYAGRLVELATDELVLMGFINVDADHPTSAQRFIGAIDDPRPLDLTTLRATATLVANRERRAIPF